MKLPKKLSDFLMRLAQHWALKQKNPSFNKHYQKFQRYRNP